MKFKSIIVVALATAAAWGTSGFAQQEKIVFPAIERAWLKGGTFVDVEQLRRIGRGMTPSQVRELISYPHFHEGFGLSNWNYIFNFRTGNNNDHITCQYQVQFKDGKSNMMHWKDQKCEVYVKEKKPVVIVNQTHPVVLDADGLFAFGRSSFADLQERGRQNLRDLVAQMKSGYKTIRSINVVGYTDRFGSVASNQVLSLDRANTVKRYFISQGIDSSVIRTQGAGSTDPVVNCSGPKSNIVIACLMPNRRIEVTVNGDL